LEQYDKTMIDGKAEVKAWERYLSRDANFRLGWDTLAPYLAPTRTDVLTTGIKTPGQDQARFLYDSTSISACELAAKFVWGNVCNPATKWLDISPKDEQLNELDEVREWCDEVVKRMLSAYLASNFYYEAFESLIDLIGFGTMDMHIRERSYGKQERPELGFRGFIFKSYPIGSFAIDENANGEVDVRYACFPQSAWAIVSQYGERASEKIQTAALRTPEQQFEIIHCIKPRDYAEQKSKASKHMPYASAWVEKETGQVLKESGYEEFPDAVARYAKTPGEVNGRGKGFTALPDIRTLNTLKFDDLEMLEFINKPALLTALGDDTLGSVQLFPGGLTAVKLRPGMSDVRQALAPLELAGRGRPEISLKEEQLSASIERIFEVNQIRNIIENDKAQTAFEVAQKLALLNKLMGPVWGRMQAEWFNKLNDRAFNLMLRRQAFPPPPKVLLEQGADFDWKYNGPLALAQRAGEIDAIMSYSQQATIISQFEPDAVLRFDGDKAMKVLAEVGGVPAKVTRSDEEVKALLDARREAREKQTEQENILAATEAAKNLAPLANTVIGQQAA
jgi:hypothetical protein